MNPIERLRRDLAKRFPGIAAEIDAPADEAGNWILDVRPGGEAPWIVVEWKPSSGFGVSTPGADDYGVKPDELYTNEKAALARVVRLILSGRRTEPPTAVRLAELRQMRGLVQADLAARAGVKQAAVARIEGRGDVRLSTLNRIITAMGGTLSIRARFPDGEEREVTGLGSIPPVVSTIEGAVTMTTDASSPRESPSTGRRSAKSASKSTARSGRKAAGKAKTSGK